MKKYLYLPIVALILVSCGARSGYVEISGKLLHLNQGELYIYSLDGTIRGVDTIKIAGGDFTYETRCEDESTLILVFPNFSEHPIFAKPGKSIRIKADAAHLKEMEVTGTEPNELMTKFRKQVSDASPPEAGKYAIQFINDHPESVVGTYLVNKYFITSAKPDYRTAAKLIGIMSAKQPKNKFLNRYKPLVENLKNTLGSKQLPTFTDYDTNGKLVSSTTLNSSPVAVISVWASWNYESLNMQRQLKEWQRKAKGKLEIVSICMDASKQECKKAMKRDSITWKNICDGEMFDGKTFRKLGFSTIPDNMILQNGKIVERGLTTTELKEKLDKIL